jgi:hypothetical protein
MRSTLLVLLCAAAAQASAQTGVLVSPLPEGVAGPRAVEVARKVLVANRWTLVPSDRTAIDARKDNSGIRVFASGGALRFSDQSVRARGVKQREHRDEGPQLTAVPQAEIDALRADLVAAFEGRPTAGAAGTKSQGQVLIGFSAGADPRQVMQAARAAFTGRRWEVKDDGEAAFIADIRGAQESATLKVFVVDGALRFIDRSTDRRGGDAKAPERWLNNIRADLRQPLSQLARGEEKRPAARADAGSAGDPVERLRKLKAAFDSGLITQSEYDAKRAEILKGL